MDRTRILITPSLSLVIDQTCRDWLTLERNTPEGATIGSLFKELGRDYPELGRLLFDPDTGDVSEGVTLVLNGNLLKEPAVAGIKLNNGDTLTILPTYYGG